MKYRLNGQRSLHRQTDLSHTSLKISPTNHCDTKRNHRSAASHTIAIAISPGVPVAFCQFDLDTSPADLFAVQIVDGVVGVARVLEFHEAVPLLQTDLVNDSIALERGMNEKSLG